MKAFLKILGVLVLVFGLAVALFHEKKSTAEAAEENTLQIYFMYHRGEPQAAWLQDAIGRFEESIGQEVNEDVVYAGREVMTKARPRLIMGKPPDIITQGGDMMRPVMLDGLMHPLDEALAGPAWDSQVPWRETFLPGLLDFYTYRGHTYMVPIEIFVSVFFYDRRMFEKYGLEEPRTWEEFLHVCEVLKQSGIEPIAADGTIIGYNTTWFSTLVSRVTSGEHFRAAALDEPDTSWEEEPYLRAAGMVKELVRKGYVMEGYQGSTWPAAQVRWANGDCGLLYNGSWIPKEMGNKLPPEFELDFFRFPVTEDGVGEDMSQVCGAECYAVPRDARHKELAIEFIRYVTSKEEMNRFVKLQMPPAVKGVEMPPGLKGLREILTPPYELVHSFGGVQTDLPEWYRNVARDLWSDLFLCRVGPEEMCRKMDEVQDRYYERLETLGKPKIPEAAGDDWSQDDS